MPSTTIVLTAITVNTAVAILTLRHTRKRAADRAARLARPQPLVSARSSAPGRGRKLLFSAVYYVILPIGHAQAWLARGVQRAGLGLGWPLLLLWWPLRQAYTFGFQLCWALRP